MGNEYEKLDLELRTLRAKKLEAEKEIKGLFNKKITLLEESKKLKIDVMSARDNYKAEQAKVSELRKSNKELSEQQDETGKELSNERKSLQRLLDSISGEKADIIKLKREMDIKLENIRERENIAATKAADNKERAAQLKDDLNATREGKILIKKSLDDLNAKKITLFQREESFSKSLNDAQNTKNLLEMKVAEVGTQKNALKAEKQATDSLKEQLDAKAESHAKTDILLSVKQDELNAALKSVEMTRKALEVQQKELERDKLQFTKLAREKGLDKELADLKKALA